MAVASLAYRTMSVAASVAEGISSATQTQVAHSPPRGLAFISRISSVGVEEQERGGEPVTRPRGNRDAGWAGAVLEDTPPRFQHKFGDCVSHEKTHDRRAHQKL